MTLNYREDLNEVTITDSISTQKTNAIIFSVIIITSCTLNIINNRSNLLFYASVILAIASIGYAIYLMSKKSYKKSYKLAHITQLKTITILGQQYYRFQLITKKHRDLEVSKQGTSLADLIEFCKQHKIPIKD
ncbi:hypothetical protein QYR09_09600 [Cellulophaga lytica]|nr:hypothetical protein QYR09_09600 [Cellulophaga lytica]